MLTYLAYKGYHRKEHRTLSLKYTIPINPLINLRIHLNLRRELRCANHILIPAHHLQPPASQNRAQIINVIPFQAAAS